MTTSCMETVNLRDTSPYLVLSRLLMEEGDMCYICYYSCILKCIHNTYIGYPLQPNAPQQYLEG